MSISTLTSFELEGKDAHADKVAPVDALVGLGDHSVDTLKHGSLGSPITGGTRAVLVSCEDDELLASILVLLGGIEDGHLLARGHMDGRWADLRHHLVDQTHVGESATGHDFIVATTRAVRVEVLGLDSALG